MGRLPRFLAAFVFVAVLAASAQAADSVTTKTLRNTGGTFGSNYAFIFSNASDGTGESAVVKVSTAALQGTPTKLKITKLKWSTQGMGVTLLFDANTDDKAISLFGDGEYDADKQGGPLVDPQSTGHTGNILFTTVGHSAGDGYTIYLEAKATD